MTVLARDIFEADGFADALDQAVDSSTAEVGGLDALGDTSTSEILTVGGSIDGVINVLGDQDWAQVTLTAGQSYLFTMTKQVAGSATDPFLRLYAADGTTLITFNDDGAPSNNSSIRYTPTATGTFYISAGAFQDESTGGYHLSLAAVAPQNPLDAINWGTQLASTQIRVYFATTGQTFGDATAIRSWTPTEKAAFFQASSTWSNITNVTFAEVGTSDQATMVEVLDPTIEAIGFMTTPPGLPNVGAFDPTGGWWTTAGALSPGGKGFQAMIHEIGHALGLAHPHDDGGFSQVLEGVTGQFNSYGVTGLNQGVFTVMSYNDGWPLGPSGGRTNYTSGSEASPMAMDIAVVQQKYGATSHSTGTDLYTLGTVGGSQYVTIWDTGGNDGIVDNTGHDDVIDLRAATLASGVSAGQGGFLSYWSDSNSHGGFTIAAGVTIENAASSIGNDHLIGNDVANMLTSREGNDHLEGGGGDDTLNAGPGNDVLEGGAGDDLLMGGPGVDVFDGGPGIDTAQFDKLAGGTFVNLGAGLAHPMGGGPNDTLISINNVIGSDYDDVILGDNSANVLDGGGGGDQEYGLAGDDALYGRGGFTMISLGADYLDGGPGNDTYFVTCSLDLGPETIVFEGGANPDFAAGAGDVDTIISRGAFFWDFYSVGEVLMNQPDPAAFNGTTVELVGGKDVTDKAIFGWALTDLIMTYGHNSVVDAGAGTDVIIFDLFGLDPSYRGHNTVIMKPGSGLDYVYSFLSGTDKIDLSAFHYQITAAQLLGLLVDVDNPGTDNDYTFLYLGGAGGVNNFIVFMGLQSSQLHAGDFIV